MMGKPYRRKRVETKKKHRGKTRMVSYSWEGLQKLSERSLASGGRCCLRVLTPGLAPFCEEEDQGSKTTSPLAFGAVKNPAPRNGMPGVSSTDFPKSTPS